MNHYEMFIDESYYDLWCVRIIGQRKFGEGRHYTLHDKAQKAMEQLESRWETDLHDQTEFTADH